MTSVHTIRHILGPIARIQRRTISMSAQLYAEGSTGSGSSRPGGAASGDAFTKREKANEDFYVREQEKRKADELKEKIRQQREHLDELERHVDEMKKDRK